MRNLDRWNKVIRPKIVKQFTPRIQRDLKLLKTPKTIPKDFNSVFIWSKTSHTGKTILSIFYLLQEQKDLYLTAKNETCVFITMESLLTKIKESYFKGGLSDDNFLDYYLSAHLLIIDDIGVEKPSEWVYSIIYNLINTRIEYLRKTIITSNQDLDGLSNFFGDNRITSRIDREYEILNKKKFK